MPVPEVTTGADIIDVAANLPLVVNLSANATNAPTGFTWTMEGVPLSSSVNIGVNGDFNNGVALVQNPTFTADVSGTYVLQCIATNGAGDSDPDVDGLNAQQLAKVRSALTNSIIPSYKQLRYDDELNETLNTFEVKLAKVPDTFNVKNYGAEGDGLTDDFTAFSNAITAAQVADSLLDIPPGDYFIDSSLTLPSDITVRFQPGSKISINTGSTLTVDCYIDAGNWQIFDGSGTVTAAGIQSSEVLAAWFGVSTTGDTTAALNKMFTALGADKKVKLSRGTYAISGQVLIDAVNVELEGEADGSTILSLTPGAPVTALKLELNGGGDLNNITLRNLRFTSADTTFKKIAVEAIDCVNLTLENIGTVDGFWDGVKSSALEITGGDRLTARKCAFYASKPILFTSANSLGSYAFYDMVLDAKDNVEPCVEVDDAADFVTIEFSGYQRWFGGNGGFKYTDVGATAASGYVVLRNVVHQAELAGPSPSYTVNVESNQGVDGVTLENITSVGANSNHGFRFRFVRSVVVVNCRHNAGAPTTALELDNVIHATFAGFQHDAAATVTLTGMIPLFEAGRETGQLISPNSVWTGSGSTDEYTRQQDVLTYKTKVSMADATTVTLPIGASAFLAAKVVAVAVDQAGQGSVIEEAALWSVTRGGTAIKLSGTANTDVLTGAGSPPASKLTLWREANNLVKVANELGQTVDVFVTVEFTL